MSVSSGATACPADEDAVSWECDAASPADDETIGADPRFTGVIRSARRRLFPSGALFAQDEVNGPTSAGWRPVNSTNSPKKLPNSRFFLRPSGNTLIWIC
jgi:hypothetical protein